MSRYNNTTNPMPDNLRAVGSPFMVNTLMELGYSTNETIALLGYANENNDHPDWSEATMREISSHFRILKQMMEMETT